MVVVSVINYKGGVGKTSITSNLGAELAWRGFNVLLLDMDPQASLTFSFVKPEYWQKNLEKDKTIRDWYSSMSSGSTLPLANLIHTPEVVASYLGGKGKLDLIPSHLGLINVDLELATELGGASLKQAKQRYVKVHRRLAEGLGQLGTSDYDIVLIDCPPNFNIVTKNALVASQHILVPAKPDYLSTLGIDYLRRSISSLIQDYNEYASIQEGAVTDQISPTILGVVFTMIQEYDGGPIAALRPYIRQTQQLGVPIFNAYIKENKTLFADAPQYGVPVVLVRRNNQSHQSVVDGLENFVGEFCGKLGLKKASTP